MFYSAKADKPSASHQERRDASHRSPVHAVWPHAARARKRLAHCGFRWRPNVRL